MSNYHVDYTNGSNTTGDGSAGNPWGTVVFAMTEAATGPLDTIKVAGSGLTTVDSTATLAGPDTLTTTTDLTTSISVGDMVAVMPNGVAEFADWVTMYVVAISATTIQFYEDCYMPGDWNAPSGGTSKYTIKTIDSIYESTAGTFENFTDGLGEGTTVEGGYNTAFTAIVGLTYIRRGGLGAGSKSGTCYKLNYPANNIDIPIIKNIWFGQWTSSLDTGFAGLVLGNNLHSYLASSRTFAYYGAVWNVDGNPVDLYWINAGSTFGRNANGTNASNAGYNKKVNARIFQGNNTGVEFVHCVVNKQHIWNPGQNANGAAFGSTLNIKQLEGCMFDNAEYVTNIIEANRGTLGGTSQSVLLWEEATGKLSTLTLIDGNTTLEWFYEPLQVSGTPSTTKQTIQMPATYDLLDVNTLSHLRGSRGGPLGMPQNLALTDINGTWINGAGTYQKVSTTFFDTGNSSRQIILGAAGGTAYGSEDPKILLASVTKTGAALPTTITVRATGIQNPKPGALTSCGTRLYYANSYYGGNLTTTNVQLYFTSLWQDLVWTVASDTNAQIEWDAIPIGGQFAIQMNALFYSNAPTEIYIDSVTVTY